MERAVVAAAAARGVAVEGLHDGCATATQGPPTLLLGYAALPEPALERAAVLLADAVRSA